MVADQIRGLVWYVRPHTSLQFFMANPGFEQLRISGIHNTDISYATLIAGNNEDKEGNEDGEMRTVCVSEGAAPSCRGI